MENGIKFLRPKDFNLGEDWSDIYLEVKNIRKGDVFFECIRGENHELVALTSARRISDGYFVTVKDSNGNVGEIFYSEFTNYPAPNLFREPQYITEINKEIVYVID
jgi:hypothetical protein